MHRSAGVKGANIGVAGSRCGSVILVDEAAETVATVNRASEWLIARARCSRWTQLECTVGPLAVVVVGVDAKDVREVAAVEDQEPVEAL